MDYIEDNSEVAGVEDFLEKTSKSENELRMKEHAETISVLKDLHSSINDLNTTVEGLSKTDENYTMDISNVKDNKGRLLAQEKLQDIQVSIYEKDISFSGNNIPLARDIYYAQQLGLKLRHISAELRGGQLVFDGDKFRSSSGYLKFSRIRLGFSSMLKGFIRQNNEESFFLPSITGNGSLQLKDTVKYLYMIKCVDNRKFILEQGVYCASAGQFDFGIHADTKLGSMAFSKKNILQTTVRGRGILILELPVPPSELVVLNVTPERPVRVNEQEVIYREGDVSRNKKLASGVFGSMASGTGFIEEYTGNGLVILAPSLNLTEIIHADFKDEINEVFENTDSEPSLFDLFKKKKPVKNNLPSEYAEGEDL